MRRALRGTASGSHDADAFRLALSGIIAEAGSTVQLFRGGSTLTAGRTGDQRRGSSVSADLGG